MKAIVLAAGKGTRLHSEEFNLPKVLREALGKPLLGYVLSNISFVNKKDICIVIGYMGEKVRAYAGEDYAYAVQNEQKGTGHAVMMAKDEFEGYDGDVLIVYGDMPLFKEETYKAICKKHKESGAALTLLTADIKNPPAYGRIIRDENGSVKDIVEEKDCTDEQKRITELNVGVYVADAKLMFETLKGLKNNNAQGEYYLTDLPKMLIAEGRKVESYTTYDAEEIVGVNTPEELAFCEKVLAERK